MPHWASWTYGCEYLPPSFHTREGFTRDIEAIVGAAGGDNPLPATLLLGCGLAIREINKVHFSMSDPDDPPPADMPTHVIISPLTLEDIPTIENVIGDAL